MGQIVASFSADGNAPVEREIDHTGERLVSGCDVFKWTRGTVDRAAA